MILPYGKKTGRLIHISEVPSGQTDLRCPYCAAELLAKKGKQIAHHFAHVGKSCLGAGSAALLDIGKKLPTQLSLASYSERKLQYIQQALRKREKQRTFLDKKNTQNKQFIKNLVAYLQAHKQQVQAKLVVAYVRYEFETFPNLKQLPNSFAPHIAALHSYHPTKQQAAEATDKLALYQKELEWFHSFKVYFLEIKTGEYNTFYKIGLTSRALSERIQEIRKDLNYFPQLEIQVLYELQGVAFLETFFKQKYRKQRYQLAQHTEYFAFEYYELEAIKKELEWLKK